MKSENKETPNYSAWVDRMLEDLSGGQMRDLDHNQSNDENGEEETASNDDNAPEVDTIKSNSSKPLDDVALSQLKKIRSYASWSGDNGRRQLEEVKEAFLLAYPAFEQLTEIAIREGSAFSKMEADLYNAIAAKGKSDAVVQELLAQARKEMPWGSYQINKTVERAHKKYSKRMASKKARLSGEPLSNVKPRSSGALSPTFGGKPLAKRRGVEDPPNGLHGSDVRALTPSSAWTILIDETGSEFGSNANRVSESKKGKFVAVVVPVSPPALNPLPQGWHAVDCESDKEIDGVFQAVLDAEVGVLGVEVASLPVTPNERWMDGVGLLVDWILRLLPVDGPTKIEVLVENRKEFAPGQQWQLVERECIRRLALAFPAAAGWIDLDIRVIGKNDSPMNGYVDAIAYTWARTSQNSIERLKLSKLCGPCLLDTVPRDLLAAWDAFAQGVNLPPSLWWELIPSARGVSTLVGSLLWNLGVECHADAAIWSKYLAETRARMAGGGVDLFRLGAAVDWLEQCIPEQASIPPMMRLCWLTAKLAHSNHMGKSETAWEKELVVLSAPLIEENAPLVCYADLHLAVSRTNRYDFDGASTSLAKWNSLPVAVAGLQRWGQVKSSLGQHAAFQGDHEEAVNLFDEAIEAYEKLSDPKIRKKEILQTNCYRAISMIDHDAFSDAMVKEAVQKVTGGLVSAAANLGSSDSPQDRYAHHLLMRWLIHRGDHSVQNIYMADESNWYVGEGHPWPLIQLYRAILLQNKSAKRSLEFSLDASAIAFSANQGPVVRLIGACSRKIAVHWGEPWTAESDELKNLKVAIPKAEAQISFLENWNGKDSSALLLMKTVLPFNFR